MENNQEDNFHQLQTFVETIERYPLLNLTDLHVTVTTAITDRSHCLAC
jgi:hypothetical protein